jgi:uncharacterized protein YxeA
MIIVTIITIIIIIIIIIIFILLSSSQSMKNELLAMRESIAKKDTEVNDLKAKLRAATRDLEAKTREIRFLALNITISILWCLSVCLSVCVNESACWSKGTVKS